MSSVSAAPRFGFATLWRETVVTFSTHAGPVVVSAWIGFAALAAALQGLRSLTGLTSVSDRWVLLASAMAAVLLEALAQGALAWIGLHGGDGPASNSSTSSLAEALKAATAGGRGLLPGALLHALLTFLCALSLTPLLLSSGLVEVNLDPISPNWDTWPRVAATRSLDAVALGVLPPLGEWVAPARIALLPAFLQTETLDEGLWRAFELKNHVDPSDQRRPPVYLAPLAVLPAA